MIEVGELSYYEYRLLLRDAVIHMLNQTSKGQEYLRNAWLYEQTSPDRHSLREKFGQTGGVNG